MVDITGTAGRHETSPGLVRPASTPRWHGIARQVAWASVPVWSIGLLTFVPFLVLAVTRRTAGAWTVFAAYCAAVIAEIALVSAAGPDGGGSAAAGGLIIMLAGVGAVHAGVAFRPGARALTPAPPAGPALAQPNHQALVTAEARIQRRQEARLLAGSNPELARELKIGRPDLSRDYDDGGLVDVNHVPAPLMASALGLTHQEAAAVTAARQQLGSFSSPEELGVYANLQEDRVDEIRDHLLFG